MIEFNLYEMLSGNLSRIRNVIRFSNSTRIKDESVAEHTFFTAYYAMILGHVLQAKENTAVDFGKLLSRALVHDIDEAITGDFIRHFKYSDPKLHAQLDAASDELMKHAFDKTCVDISEKMHEAWKTAKDPNTVEGDILAFADFLSVLSYVVNELECGNRKLITQLDDMYAYAHSFYHRALFKERKEPRWWLDSAISILNAYIGRN